MADTKGITDAAKKYRGVINPCSTLGDIAKSKGAVVVQGVLHEHCMLLTLASNRGLISSEYFVCMHDWQLFNGYVFALGIFNYNGRAMCVVTEEGGSGGGEIESHRLI